MIVRESRPEEARRINELFAVCFETPYSNCPIDPEGDDALHWVALDADGEMMSTLTVSDYVVNFDGRACVMGGVGGVATLPQYRRMGGIRGCFQAALPELYRQGYDFSYLYPFSTAYYRKFGYECCCQSWQWKIDLSRLSPLKAGGTFRLVEKAHPQTREIQALDALWEHKYNMMVRHRPSDYLWVSQSNPAVKQEFTYVCYDEADKPTAYVTFRPANEPDGRNLQCSRFCFSGKSGFLTAMALFKSLSADHTYAKFKTPVIRAWQYLMPEWSQGAVKWENLASHGMVRVINVPEVLEKAAYLGSGAVTLEIQDLQIPENTGRFTVTFKNGQALSVERTENVPDALLTISAFSALIAGTCGIREADGYLSGLEAAGSLEALSQVFYEKPMWITDYF